VYSVLRKPNEWYKLRICAGRQTPPRFGDRRLASYPGEPGVPVSVGHGLGLGFVSPSSHPSQMPGGERGRRSNERQSVADMARWHGHGAAQ
jgi:hypothetical protein